MPILLVYAAPAEAGDLPGRLASADVGFLALGVGKVAAATALARRLATAGAVPELVLLFGVCGAYAGGPAVGDVCVVTSDQLADEGVDAPEGFLDLAALSLGSNGPFPMSAGPTERLASALDVPRVTAATVSTGSGRDDLAARIAARTGAAIETMEGAAVAHACAAAAVPLAQLRCVSNRTGDRSRAGWDLEGACRRLQGAVEAAIPVLVGR